MKINDILKPGEKGFYRIQNSDGKIWLMPEKNIRQGFELYQPGAKNGKLLKKYFPLIHKLQSVRKRLGVERLQISLLPEILKAAEKTFNVADIEYSVYGGTPSPHQKIIIQFFKDDNILGYGKLTDKKDINRLFMHERDLLSEMKQKGMEDIPIPLFCEEITPGIFLFIQDTKKKLNSIIPDSWTPLHEAFLGELTEKTATKVKFEDSDFAKSLGYLQENLHRLPSRHAKFIAPPLEKVITRLSGSKGNFGVMHGDFTPWNTFADKNNLFVFDWEYGARTYPPLLDKYHFFVQNGLLVDHLNTDEVLKMLNNQKWYSREEFRFYLLDIISRYLSREPETLSDSLLDSIDKWTELLKRIERN